MDIKADYRFHAKPCPACGNISCSLFREINAKNNIPLINYNPTTVYSEMMWFKVKCDACNYTGKHANTEESAIFNWNNDKNRK